MQGGHKSEASVFTMQAEKKAVESSPNISPPTPLRGGVILKISEPRLLTSDMLLCSRLRMRGDDDSSVVVGHCAPGMCRGEPTEDLYGTQGT